jgi:hypothetical protein
VRLLRLGEEGPGGGLAARRVRVEDCFLVDHFTKLLQRRPVAGEGHIRRHCQTIFDGRWGTLGVATRQADESTKSGWLHGAAGERS